MSLINKSLATTIPKIPFMIDLETYDTSPTAVILSIGACLVSPELELNPQDTFYVELSLSTQYERTISEPTRDWWAQQEAAGNRCPNTGMISIRGALQMLSDWLASYHCSPIIWCKGTDFDVAILANAYQQCRLPVPWRYSDVRDLRTLMKATQYSQAKLASHNALDDATNQASHLLAMAKAHNLCLV